MLVILATKYHDDSTYSQLVLIPGITLKKTHCDLTGSNEYYIVFDWGKWYVEFSLEVL